MSNSDMPYPPFSGKDASCPKCGGLLDVNFREAGTAHALADAGLLNTGQPEEG